MKPWPSSSSRDCSHFYTTCPEDASSSDGEGSVDQSVPDKKDGSRTTATTLADYLSAETEHSCTSVGVVGFQEDMYDAVSVAAFGGVVLQLPRGCIRVHPLWMFVMAAPLFLSQQAALLYLRLGQDLESPVHGEGVEGELKKILPFAKVLMIYTMALMLFPELLDALRLMMFLANPTTWTDIQRVDPRHRKFMPWIWSGWFVGPIGFISEGLKFCIGYIVLVDSVSIVLGCSSVQDAIFNSLALAFLVELDNQLWTVAQSVFHLKFSFQQFTFRSPEERQEAAQKAWLTIRPRSWLHRLHGAPAVEACLTSAVFTFFYCRQFLVTEYSLRTDTLPMARDMCTLWRLTEDDSWLGDVVRSVLRFISLHDKPNEMLNHMCNPALGGYCNDRFRRIMLHDMYDLILEKPLATVTNMVTFAIILLIPQIFQLAWILREEHNSNGCIAMLCPRGVEEEPHPNDEHEALRAEVRKLDLELRELKSQLAKPTLSAPSWKTACEWQLCTARALLRVKVIH